MSITKKEQQVQYSNDSPTGHAFDSAELQQVFDRDGFVALPGFLSESEVENVHCNLARFMHEIVPCLPREQVFYEQMGANETLKQLQAMHSHDGFFRELFTEGKFPALAGVLLRDKEVPVNMQYFNKPAGIGQPTPAHQDGYYFKITPCEAVTMWLALDNVDQENGCVRYVRGSHRQGVRPHSRTQTLGFSQGISNYPQPGDEANEVAFPAARPGDLLVHHALTIHRADGNRSSHRSRRALGFIYYAKRPRVDVAEAATYQARLNQEMIAFGKI